MAFAMRMNFVGVAVGNSLKNYRVDICGSKASRITDEGGAQHG